MYSRIKNKPHRDELFRPLSILFEIDLDRETRGGGQTFPCTVIDHSQNPEPAAISELIRNKIKAPALVGQQWHKHRGPRSKGAFAPAPLAHGELFLAVEPEQPLVVDGDPLAPQQHMDASSQSACAQQQWLSSGCAVQHHQREQRYI